MAAAAETPERHPLLRILQAADNAVNRIESACLVVGVLAMTAVGMVNVVARNLLGFSLVFAEEINQVLIVLITFIGVGYAARQGRHIRMTAFYDQLPPTAKRWLMAGMTAVTALMLFALAWYGMVYVQHTRAAGSVTPALHLPLWWIYSIVPVGLALGGLQYLLTAVRNLTADEVYLSFSRSEAEVDAAADTEGAL